MTQPAAAPAQTSNTLAVIALLASLFAPLEYVLNILSRLLLWFIPIIGIFGVLTFPAIVLAIVLGHIALSQSKRYAPAQANRGMAITALVLGYVELAFVMLVIGAIILIFTVLRTG